jgi:two-component system, LuxR family, sensor kinase FixL
MASGLAHELNQPLAAVGNYIGALRCTVERPDEVMPARAKTAAESVNQYRQRAGEVVRWLRNFVKNRNPNARRSIY